jgi:hypothetical protein
MKYIVTISRILLGLILVVFGLNGFLRFVPTPQYPGVAGHFLGVIFKSHFYIVVFLAQILGGLFLLANRYVRLGPLLLGPGAKSCCPFFRSLPKVKIRVTIPVASSFHASSWVVICAAKYLSLQFPTILIKQRSAASV